jgi:hypothetical protein
LIFPPEQVPCRFSLNLPLFGLGALSTGLGTNLKLLTDKIAWIHWSLHLGPSSKIAWSLWESKVTFPELNLVAKRPRSKVEGGQCRCWFTLRITQSPCTLWKAQMKSWELGPWDWIYHVIISLHLSTFLPTSHWSRYLPNLTYLITLTPLVVFPTDPTITKNNDKRNKMRVLQKIWNCLPKQYLRTWLIFLSTHVWQYRINPKNLECMQYLQVHISYIPWSATLCFDYHGTITQIKRKFQNVCNILLWIFHTCLR